MYKTILVPAILSETRDTHGAFEAARALADEDAKFIILHVIEDMPGYVATYIPEEVVAQTRREVQVKLQDLAKELPGATINLGRGHAGRAITDFAKDHDVDCIVVASHRPGLQDVFLGSTADWVVRHSACSVHVVR